MRSCYLSALRAIFEALGWSKYFRFLQAYKIGLYISNKAEFGLKA
ncbi:hypothetical protein [Helicobacter pullorum]|nr:hypothetical protein [Helicobacter pullorum]